MGLAGGRTVVGARGGPGGDSRPPGPTEGQGPLGRWKRPPPAVPLFRRNPSPPGVPKLLWRKFDASSSPCATYD
jgi:hypothetical protein